jgi:hypothetical protein
MGMLKFQNRKWKIFARKSNNRGYRYVGVICNFGKAD